MTKLILIRHGQSQSNIAGIFTGHLDVPLTDLGRQQAQSTADYILANYPVDRVYASDLCRAFDTGKVLADRLGQEVIPCADLREIYAGQWEGQTFQALTENYPDSYNTFRQDIGRCICDGGESVFALQRRVVRALRKIGRIESGHTVAIATHATPIRAMQNFIRDASLSKMKDIPWVTNASITVLTFEDYRFRIELEGFDAHLGDMISRFPKNV